MNEQLPSALLNSLNGLNGFNREAFEQVHYSGEQITSVRINPAKMNTWPAAWSSRIPWTQHGYYLSSRPSFTFDPLFHAGTYYVQEASSMFIEQAFRQLTDLSAPLKVLDLCAAPGGKSTHIQSLINNDSLLVSNETIRARATVLKENSIKWGGDNVVVTNNDPSHFAKMPGYFDVIVIDAPCSGSGLFRRDPELISEWSENNVQLCSQRQQRILADSWPALKENGLLIYSTCSYSAAEDEQIMEWITSQFDVTACELNIDPAWGIIETPVASGAKGYRFWPDKVKGEGFFICCFRKNDTVANNMTVKNKKALVTKKELETVGKWAKTTDHLFIRHGNTVYAWPQKLAEDFSYILDKMHVLYSGVLVGELLRDKLLPEHALAMSKLINDGIETTELPQEDAIRYLQRKDLSVPIPAKGWRLVTYQSHPLGWINSLGNRINNYYPKELRILKDSPNP